MAGRVSTCGRCHKTSSDAAEVIGGQALAVGLHLMMGEAIPTQYWIAMDAPRR